MDKSLTYANVNNDEDCDLMTTCGIKCAYNANNAPNRGWFCFLVLPLTGHEDTNIIQMAVWFFDGSVYSRKLDNGSWSTWRSVGAS